MMTKILIRIISEFSNQKFTEWIFATKLWNSGSSKETGSQLHICLVLEINQIQSKIYHYVSINFTPLETWQKRMLFEKTYLQK